MEEFELPPAEIKEQLLVVGSQVFLRKIQDHLQSFTDRFEPVFVDVDDQDGRHKVGEAHVVFVELPNPDNALGSFNGICRALSERRSDGHYDKVSFIPADQEAFNEDLRNREVSTRLPWADFAKASVDKLPEGYFKTELADYNAEPRYERLVRGLRALWTKEIENEAGFREVVARKNPRDVRVMNLQAMGRMIHAISDNWYEQSWRSKAAGLDASSGAGASGLAPTHSEAVNVLYGSVNLRQSLRTSLIATWSYRHLLLDEVGLCTEPRMLLQHPFTIPNVRVDFHPHLLTAYAFFLWKKAYDSKLQVNPFLERSTRGPKTAETSDSIILGIGADLVQELRELYTTKAWWNLYGAQIYIPRHTSEAGPSNSWTHLRFVKTDWGGRE